MLGRAIGMHWLALVRDVLALGHRAADILTSLTVVEMVAIVMASPPNSSLRDAFQGGWSREAQLLANMQEQNAGLMDLPKPYERPGAEERDPWGSGKGMFGGRVQEMTWEEAERRDQERYATAAKAAASGFKATNTRVRTI